MQCSDAPVIVEQRFDEQIQNVWLAITSLEHMKQWFFEEIPAFEPVVGFKTAFKIQSEQRVFTHLWEITEVIPLKKITYTWKYQEYPGNSKLTFELFEDTPQTTRLVLTHEVTESFPSEIPEFKRESCVQGWNFFIQEQLKRYLS
ncbi:SRPBCC family protein [Aquimarina brevivitae]|uniref:Uncharacterized protein YndB with AHSA1/START domain n=1 Tax=Aquimarina brevivitae TaxID=323412 RepID=A0A4Q7NYX9_9FLAO|nr:SRPBCC domain-containing protein [Aquimarina brevivitae]RZS92643.1 uncharacterized protein YndB with AHSA1/START domain [Aquimarina brevivitae]